MRNKNRLIITVFLIVPLTILISGCVSPPLEEKNSVAKDTNSTINITSVSWDSNSGIIEVSLDVFPSWGNWIMYVDGKEMPMIGDVGSPVVRPNAALDASPTGLLIGTEPWVTGLTEVVFPCCGFGSS